MKKKAKKHNVTLTKSDSVALTFEDGTVVHVYRGWVQTMRPFPDPALIIEKVEIERTRSIAHAAPATVAFFDRVQLRHQRVGLQRSFHARNRVNKSWFARIRPCRRRIERRNLALHNADAFEFLDCRAQCLRRCSRARRKIGAERDQNHGNLENNGCIGARIS